MNLAKEIRDLLIKKFNLKEELDSGEKIMTDGILSSIEFVKLTIELENMYDFEFEDSDFELSNFDSIESIASLVKRKQEM